VGLKQWNLPTRPTKKTGSNRTIVGLKQSSFVFTISLSDG